MAEKDTKDTPTTSDIVAPRTAASADPRFHTVTRDVTEKLKDGRIILVARKGSVLPIAQAVEMGLVKTAKPGPAETKEQKPAETK